MKGKTRERCAVVSHFACILTVSGRSDNESSREIKVRVFQDRFALVELGRFDWERGAQIDRVRGKEIP